MVESKIPTWWTAHKLNSSSVLNFGKHKGRAVRSLLADDGGWQYLETVTAFGWCTLDDGLRAEIQRHAEPLRTAKTRRKAKVLREAKPKVYNMSMSWDVRTDAYSEQERPWHLREPASAPSDYETYGRGIDLGGFGGDGPDSPDCSPYGNDREDYGFSTGYSCSGRDYPGDGCGWGPTR